MAWACHLAGVGFLTFGSYSQATTSDAPNPRGLYLRQRDADRRADEEFYVRGIRHDRCDVVRVVLRYEVDETADGRRKQGRSR